MTAQMMGKGVVIHITCQETAEKLDIKQKESQEIDKPPPTFTRSQHHLQQLTIYYGEKQMSFQSLNKSRYLSVIKTPPNIMLFTLYQHCFSTCKRPLSTSTTSPNLFPLCILQHHEMVQTMKLDLITKYIGKLLKQINTI